MWRIVIAVAAARRHNHTPDMINGLDWKPNAAFRRGAFSATLIQSKIHHLALRARVLFVCIVSYK